MDNIISSIITPIVESLMVPVKTHLGFLVSSTKYVTNMKEKMAQLILTEQDIRHNWEEAVARNLEVSRHVSPWLEEVKKINKKAQSIPTDGIECFNMVKRYKAGKQSFNILVEIQALETWKSTIVFTSAQKPLAEVASTSIDPSISTTYGTQHNFESRDLIYKAALKSLQSNDESQKKIALCGMGGVGKTTMMEHIKKDVEASKMFDYVVKVVLGENIDTIYLQRAIAKYINLEDLKEEDKNARADRLRIIFEGMSNQEKKVLVIMDDLWKAFDLKDVGLSPLPNGFKLLITSRDTKYCTQMGVRINSIFYIGFLNYVEAKTLFFSVVGLLDGDDPALQKIGEDIVKKCGGLPIAIVTIAKSLTDNIEEAWKMALWRLEKDDLSDLESITYRIFEISFENLKKDDDKAIFLLSGIFPDDFDIRLEDLLRYGWGLNFFKDAKNLAIARSYMKICVNNLLRANLLTKSDHMGCVKMHDLVRAFVLSKVSEVKQASITNYDNKSHQDAKESYERILVKCVGMIEFLADFNYPNVSMLMLMDGDELLKFPEDVYKKFEKLQVVSYENMHISSLLLTFEHSTKLRTLSLRSCQFVNDDISLLGSLSNLEILSFVDCEIRWLPSSIGKLVKLKLLDLTGCVHLRIDDGVFQSLSSLEELYMRTNFGSPIRFTKANCDELEKLSHRLFALEFEFFKNKVKPKNMSFKNLERFRISIGCELEDLELTNTIQLVGDCNDLLEYEVSELFNKTEELHLQVNEMNHLEDILTHHSFSNLTNLHVSKCADLTCLFTVDVASGLKRLERLTISECPVLRTLVMEKSRVGVLRFQKLNFMSLTGLPKMVSFWDNLIELPEMVELILVDLPNFTSIYPHSHNTSEMKSLLNEKVVIPRLEKLEIYRMENLKHIWSKTTDENNVSMLRNIRVSECNNLLNLFPVNPLPLVNHLQELVVDHCCSLEMLFNMEFNSVWGNGENISRLRSIEVRNLINLKELWRMKGVNKCDIHIKCFQGVESIDILDCDRFTNIFTPTTANFDLRALTKYITNTTGGDQEINAISKEEILEMDEDIPNATYPSYLLHTSPHLQTLKLCYDKRVKEVVFEMDSHQPLLLPYLEFLELNELYEMSHVWKCNWNKFLIPQHQPFLFQNLTNISLGGCHRMKYLFSPLMVKYLSNLKRVFINECYGIQEVISSRDDENEKNGASTSSHQSTTTLFPHLDTLELRSLQCLRSFDDGDTIHDRSQSCQEINACWSLCQYPRKINITNCPTMSILIPWYAVEQMKRLEKLTIWNCKTIMEVFENESSTNSVNEESTHGMTLTSPTLKTVHAVPQLSNLKRVTIYSCDLLPHVFTFSTLESLKQLKKLTVYSCKAMQVIVNKENGTSSKDVGFPHLETLILRNLPNLKGFFLGRNMFKWPLLTTVIISHCPQLVMFTSGQSITPKLKHIQTSFGKYSLECGLNFHGTLNEYQTTFPAFSSDISVSKAMPCSFHNLKEIKITFQHVETLIPTNVLQQLQNLEKIHLEICYELKEVFELVPLEETGFHESKTVVKIPNLTQVNLDAVYELKYLWKRNRWMVLEFPNLTTLSIDFCESLEHVFTCSMAGSLVQLQDLHIRNCKNIEIIVTEEEEEGDAKVNEIIMLPRLKSLKLNKLPRLKAFCLGKDAFSLPALDTLTIKKCQEITNFTKGDLSTPNLKVIDTDFGMCAVKGDLNSFIVTKQEEFAEQDEY